MSSRKRIFLMAAICAVMSFFLMARRQMPAYNKILEANWDFGLPAKAAWSVAYEKADEAGAHGDGLRYHVFRYEHEEFIAPMLDWETGEKATIFEESYTAAANRWMDALEVPEKCRPLPDAQLKYWYSSQVDNSEILVLWDPEYRFIFVLESFL